MYSPEFRTMHKEKLIALTRSILSQPTAPFHEMRVKQEIRRQLEKLTSVTLQEDAFGNLIARYSRGKARPKYAFSVHMDHPGWVQKPGASEGEMVFLGGIKKEFLNKADILPFDGFGIWNLPPFDLKDDKIYGRACDDLIGCAAMVAMLHDLEEAHVSASVIVLFTCAEEVGFLGAMHLAKSKFLPKAITVLSVETSADIAPAKIGLGPIIRVGDRSSIFDPEVTQQLGQIAKRNHIVHQRCLMSGGTCEGTAYQNFGLRTGAICVALANYHNCSPSTQIVREYVSYSDYVGLIKLATTIVTEPAVANTFVKDLRSNLDENLAKYKAFYEKAPEPKAARRPAIKKTASKEAAPKAKNKL